MTLFDERALQALIEQATERAVRKVLGENRSAPPDGDWAKTADLAKRYSVGQGTIRHWIRQGKLQTRRVGRGFRVNRGDFERLVAAPDYGASSDSTPEALADLDDLRQRRPAKV